MRASPCHHAVPDVPRLPAGRAGPGPPPPLGCFYLGLRGLRPPLAASGKPLQMAQRATATKRNRASCCSDAGKPRAVYTWRAESPPRTTPARGRHVPTHAPLTATRLVAHTRLPVVSFCRSRGCWIRPRQATRLRLPICGAGRCALLRAHGPVVPPRSLSALAGRAHRGQLTRHGGSGRGACWLRSSPWPSMRLRPGLSSPLIAGRHAALRPSP